MSDPKIVGKKGAVEGGRVGLSGIAAVTLVYGAKKAGFDLDDATSATIICLATAALSAVWRMITNHLSHRNDAKK